jgi:hypothetical protein
MEGVAHHQRAGTHQRGISTENQNPGIAPSEEAVLFLLFGLLRSGQVTLRRLVGWRDIDNGNSPAQAA